MEKSIERAGQGSRFIKVAALGAVIAYLFDPDLGHRRRAMFRDQIVHLGHASGCLFDKAWRDARHRFSGLLARLQSRLRREQVSDAVLESRVHTEIGRWVSHPRAIHVTADNGVVILRGPILPARSTI